MPRTVMAADAGNTRAESWDGCDELVGSTSGYYGNSDVASSAKWRNGPAVADAVEYSNHLTVFSRYRDGANSHAVFPANPSSSELLDDITSVIAADAGGLSATRHLVNEVRGQRAQVMAGPDTVTQGDERETGSHSRGNSPHAAKRRNEAKQAEMRFASRKNNNDDNNNTVCCNRAVSPSRAGSNQSHNSGGVYHKSTGLRDSPEGSESFMWENCPAPPNSSAGAAASSSRSRGSSSPAWSLLTGKPAPVDQTSRGSSSQCHRPMTPDLSAKPAGSMSSSQNSPAHVCHCLIEKTEQMSLEDDLPTVGEKTLDSAEQLPRCAQIPGGANCPADEDLKGKEACLDLTTGSRDPPDGIRSSPVPHSVPRRKQPSPVPGVDGASYASGLSRSNETPATLDRQLSGLTGHSVTLDRQFSGQSGNERTFHRQVSGPALSVETLTSGDEESRRASSASTLEPRGSDDLAAPEEREESLTCKHGADVDPDSISKHGADVDPDSISKHGADVDPDSISIDGEGRYEDEICSLDLEDQSMESWDDLGEDELRSKGRGRPSRKPAPRRDKPRLIMAKNAGQSHITENRRLSKLIPVEVVATEPNKLILRLCTTAPTPQTCTSPSPSTSPCGRTSRNISPSASSSCGNFAFHRATSPASNRRSTQCSDGTRLGNSSNIPDLQMLVTTQPAAESASGGSSALQRNAESEWNNYRQPKMTSPASSMFSPADTPSSVVSPAHVTCSGATESTSVTNDTRSSQGNVSNQCSMSTVSPPPTPQEMSVTLASNLSSSTNQSIQVDGPSFGRRNLHCRLVPYSTAQQQHQVALQQQQVPLQQHLQPPDLRETVFLPPVNPPSFQCNTASTSDFLSSPSHRSASQNNANYTTDSHAVMDLLDGSQDLLDFITLSSEDNDLQLLQAQTLPSDLFHNEPNQTPFKSRQVFPNTAHQDSKSNTASCGSQALCFQSQNHEPRHSQTLNCAVTYANVPSKEQQRFCPEQISSQMQYGAGVPNGPNMPGMPYKIPGNIKSLNQRLVDRENEMQLENLLHDTRSNLLLTSFLPSSAVDTATTSQTVLGLSGNPVSVNTDTAKRKVAVRKVNQANTAASSEVLLQMNQASCKTQTGRIYSSQSGQGKVLAMQTFSAPSTTSSYYGSTSQHQNAVYINSKTTAYEHQAPFEPLQDQSPNLVAGQKQQMLPSEMTDSRRGRAGYQNQLGQSYTCKASTSTEDLAASQTPPVSAPLPLAVVGSSSFPVPPNIFRPSQEIRHSLSSADIQNWLDSQPSITDDPCASLPPDFQLDRHPSREIGRTQSEFENAQMPMKMSQAQKILPGSVEDNSPLPPASSGPCFKHVVAPTKTSLEMPVLLEAGCSRTQSKQTELSSSVQGFDLQWLGNSFDPSPYTQCLDSGSLERYRGQKNSLDQYIRNNSTSMESGSGELNWRLGLNVADRAGIPENVACPRDTARLDFVQALSQGHMPPPLTELSHKDVTDALKANSNQQPIQDLKSASSRQLYNRTGAVLGTHPSGNSSSAICQESFINILGKSCEGHITVSGSNHMRIPKLSSHSANSAQSHALQRAQNLPSSGIVATCTASRIMTEHQIIEEMRQPGTSILHQHAKTPLQTPTLDMAGNISSYPEAQPSRETNHQCELPFGALPTSQTFAMPGPKVSHQVVNLQKNVATFANQDMVRIDEDIVQPNPSAALPLSQSNGMYFSKPRGPPSDIEMKSSSLKDMLVSDPRTNQEFEPLHFAFQGINDIQNICRIPQGTDTGVLLQQRGQQPIQGTDTRVLLQQRGQQPIQGTDTGVLLQQRHQQPMQGLDARVLAQQQFQQPQLQKCQSHQQHCHQQLDQTHPQPTYKQQSHFQDQQQQRMDRPPFRFALPKELSEDDNEESLNISLPPSTERTYEWVQKQQNQYSNHAMSVEEQEEPIMFAERGQNSSQWQGDPYEGISVQHENQPQQVHQLHILQFQHFEQQQQKQQHQHQIQQQQQPTVAGGSGLKLTKETLKALALSQKQQASQRPRQFLGSSSNLSQGSHQPSQQSCSVAASHKRQASPASARDTTMGSDVPRNQGKPGSQFPTRPRSGGASNLHPGQNQSTLNITNFLDTLNTSNFVENTDHFVEVNMSQSPFQPSKGPNCVNGHLQQDLKWTGQQSGHRPSSSASGSTARGFAQQSTADNLYAFSPQCKHQSGTDRSEDRKRMTSPAPSSGRSRQCSSPCQPCSRSEHRSPSPSPLMARNGSRSPGPNQASAGIKARASSPRPSICRSGHRSPSPAPSRGSSQVSEGGQRQHPQHYHQQQQHFHHHQLQKQHLHYQQQRQQHQHQHQRTPSWTYQWLKDQQQSQQEQPQMMRHQNQTQYNQIQRQQQIHPAHRPSSNQQNVQRPRSDENIIPRGTPDIPKVSQTNHSGAKKSSSTQKSKKNSNSSSGKRSEQGIKVAAKGRDKLAGNQEDSMAITLSSGSDGGRLMLSGDSDLSVERSASLSSGPGNSDLDGETPLHMLCYMDIPAEQIPKIAEAHLHLIDESGNRGETALFVAVQSSRMDVARFLLHHRANPNIHSYSQGSRVDQTCLHEAVTKGDEEMVKLLLTAGHNIKVDSVRPSTGMTPLMLALEYHAHDRKRSTIVKMLIRQGASLSAKDITGKTALMFAIQSGDVVLVELLLQHAGPEVARELVTMTTKHGLSCLHFAAQLQNVSDEDKCRLLRKIILAGGDPSHRNNEGDSAKDYDRKNMEAVLAGLRRA